LSHALPHVGFLFPRAGHKVRASPKVRQRSTTLADRPPCGGGGVGKKSFWRAPYAPPCPCLWRIAASLC